MSLKSVARDLLPPVVTRTVRPPQKFGPWGHYPSWEAAAKDGISYRTHFEIIGDDIERVNRRELEPPCFHGVHLAAFLSFGKPRALNVLDFGGGIGLAYHRALRDIPGYIESWRIVDLPDIVEFGAAQSKQFQQLKYFASIEAATSDWKPDIVTCSSVLQCMEDSYDALEKMFSLGAARVVLDRLPLERSERYSLFHSVSGDRLPWRILSEPRLSEIVGRNGYVCRFRQTLPKHGTAPDASLEYCLYYERL